MSGTWNTCQRKLQVVGRAWPGERSLGLHGVRPQGWAAKPCYGWAHGAIGIDVCSGVFQSCFGPILPFYAPIFPFGNGNIHSVLLYLELTELVF
jgi:hypothetical protein